MAQAEPAGAISPLWTTYDPLSTPTMMDPRSGQFHFSIGPLRRTKKGISSGEPHVVVREDCIEEMPGAGIQTVGAAGKRVSSAWSFGRALETDVKSASHSQPFYQSFSIWPTDI